jgi:transcriptional regulator NrdR family protein
MENYPVSKMQCEKCDYRNGEDCTADNDTFHNCIRKRQEMKTTVENLETYEMVCRVRDFLIKRYGNNAKFELTIIGHDVQYKASPLVDKKGEV